MFTKIVLRLISQFFLFGIVSARAHVEPDTKVVVMLILCLPCMFSKQLLLRRAMLNTVGL